MRTMILAAVMVAVGCHRATPVEEVTVDPSTPIQEIEVFVADDTEWPGWRGPRGNGFSESPAAPISWSDRENLVWQVSVPGRGHSSPVVTGSQVVLATALQEQQQQLVVAFDRATGREEWRTVLHEGGFPSERQMHPKGTHANGTVACDDSYIFIAFLNHDAIVASAVDYAGNVAWQTTLGAFNSKFGYAPSPVVYKSLVIFAADNQGGGYLAAVHRRTGEIVWRKARSRSSSYSSPIVAHTSGRDQLLISGGYEVCSYDPLSGELLWSCEGTTDATCGTMVWNESMVFASGGYPDKQTLAVRSDGSGEVVWTTPVRNYEPSMVLVGNELYAASDDGIAYCWDAATGKLHWKKRLGGSFSASPVFCNGNIYLTNSSGTTFVFTTSASRYTQIAKNQLGDDAFASPAICGGQLFIRVGTQESGARKEMLYCVGSPPNSTVGDAG